MRTIKGVALNNKLKTKRHLEPFNCFCAPLTFLVTKDLPHSAFAKIGSKGNNARSTTFCYDKSLKRSNGGPLLVDLDIGVFAPER